MLTVSRAATSQPLWQRQIPILRADPGYHLGTCSKNSSNALRDTQLSAQVPAVSAPSSTRNVDIPCKGRWNCSRRNDL